MKKLGLLVIWISVALGCSTDTRGTKTLVDYIDPNIGTAHCRWFFYTPAAVPFGMAKLAPSTDAAKVTVPAAFHEILPEAMCPSPVES